MISSDQHPSAEGEAFRTNFTQVGIDNPIDSNRDQPEVPSRVNNVADAEGAAMQSGGDIVETLTNLQPSERLRKKTAFHEHYKNVEAALARGVTHAAVRAALKEMGLSLSAATFRKLLETERSLGKSTPNAQEQSAGGAV